MTKDEKGNPIIDLDAKFDTSILEDFEGYVAPKEPPKNTPKLEDYEFDKVEDNFNTTQLIKPEENTLFVDDFKSDYNGKEVNYILKTLSGESLNLNIKLIPEKEDEFTKNFNSKWTNGAQSVIKYIAGVQPKSGDYVAYAIGDNFLFKEKYFSQQPNTTSYYEISFAFLETEQKYNEIANSPILKENRIIKVESEPCSKGYYHD